MTVQNELEFMELAVNIARNCKSEDSRSPPKVGAVVVKEGKVLAEAFRGEIEPGEHAEYTVLEKKLKDDSLSGCTIYTTLEPCTERNHPKISCTKRIKDRKIARVVIGMLDPNQNITGKGILELRRAGIEVALFPPNLMTVLEELNRDFIRDQETQKYSNLSNDKKDYLPKSNREDTNIEIGGNKYSELEDSIIALCSPHKDTSIKEILESLDIAYNDREFKLKVSSAIGKLKRKGIIYNYYGDTIRLKPEFLAL